MDNHKYPRNPFTTLIRINEYENNLVIYLNLSMHLMLH